MLVTKSNFSYPKIAAPVLLTSNSVTVLQPVPQLTTKYTISLFPVITYPWCLRTVGWVNPLYPVPRTQLGTLFSVLFPAPNWAPCYQSPTGCPVPITLFSLLNWLSCFQYSTESPVPCTLLIQSLPSHVLTVKQSYRLEVFLKDV